MPTRKGLGGGLPLIIEEFFVVLLALMATSPTKHKGWEVLVSSEGGFRFSFFGIPIYSLLSY